jgi:hypothetical protein
MLSQSILSYQGPLTFSTIDWLLSEFKMAAQDHSVPFRAYKKMISIMIEALENVSRYSEVNPANGERMPGFNPSCQINRSSGGIELITRNPVKKRDVALLRKRIDDVNKHNREELKSLYKTTITNGEFTSQGGAGLGFIEMAKTAGSKLEYQFETLTDDYCLYTLKVYFNT